LTPCGAARREDRGARANRERGAEPRAACRRRCAAEHLLQHQQRLDISLMLWLLTPTEI
jgi:hypothetical protein